MRTDAAADHHVAPVLDHQQPAAGAQQRLDVAAVGRAADAEVHALGQAEVARVAVAHAGGPLDPARPPFRVGSRGGRRTRPASRRAARGRRARRG